MICFMHSQQPCLEFDQSCIDLLDLSAEQCKHLMRHLGYCWVRRDLRQQSFHLRNTEGHD